jgi:hypothetical protein
MQRTRALRAFVALAIGSAGWNAANKIANRRTNLLSFGLASHLREAGVIVRPPGLWGHQSAVADLAPVTATGVDAGPPRAKPANEVITDFGAAAAEAAGPPS